MMLNIWHSTFAIPKHTNVISWFANNSDKMVIYTFLLGFLDIPDKKSDTSVKYKRLLNLTHHKHKPQNSLA